MAIDPVAPATIYAGSFYGVYKSVNNGATWTLTNNGLGYRKILSLLVDPRTPNTVFAGTEEDGIFFSTDGSASWSPFNNGMGAVSVRCLMINPHDPDFVYVGTEGFGAYRYGASDGYQISGNVTFNSLGLAGVILSGLPDNPMTDASGNYGVTVPQGWTGTVIPVLNGYRFAPYGLAYSNTSADYLNQDYTAILSVSTIAGIVTYNGAPLAGVTMNGLPGNPVTDSTGNYSATVPYLWSGEVVPALTGFLFEPAARTYNQLVSDQLQHNYRAIQQTFIISGTIAHNGGGLPGVTVSGLPGNPVTDALGFYYVTVPYGWTGMAVPSLNGYSFNPLSRSFHVTSHYYSQNFVSGALPNEWISIGPFGASVLSLAVDPLTTDILYAGTHGAGVFKSTDGGTNWIKTNQGLEDLYINCLAVAPGSPGTLYAGTRDGVYRSVNGGADWWEINNGGLWNKSIKTLAINPLDSNTIYAGTESGTLFKSIDRGDHWFPMGDLLPYGAINTIALNPLTPNQIYAGIDNQGIYKSLDGGIQWSAFNNGLTNKDIRCLMIDPQNPDVIYAGSAGGIFKSFNGGVTWFAINEGLTDSYIEGLAVDPQISSTLYAFSPNTMFKSVDSGAHWIPLRNGIEILSIVVHPQSPYSIYLGMNGGVFKSTDGGSQWIPMNTGLINLYIRNVAIDPLMDNMVYANAVTQIFRSLDNGESWVQIASPTTYTTTLTLNPQMPNILYAGSGSYVFRSQDHGDHWDPIALIEGASIDFLVIDPRNTNTIYAGGSSGLFKSADSGINWTPLNNGLINLYITAIGLDPFTVNTLYVTTGNGIFKTTDGGLNWVAVNNGLTYPNYSCIAVNPHTPNLLFAGTQGGGLFRSTDGGANWMAINSQALYYVFSITSDPLIPGTLYVGTSNGVFKSSDNGGTWQPFNDGIASQEISSIAVNPRSSSTLFAGTSGFSVFKYTYPTHFISGFMTVGGVPLAGVTMSGLPGNPITDTSGAYSVTIPHGWSGTVTPSLSGYTFLPGSLTYYNVIADQTLQNYTATLLTLSISGTITHNGSGLAGVILNGLPGNPATDASGNYSAAVLYGSSGTVVPSLNGYTFTPDSRSYSNVTSDQTSQNYTATLLTYAISGTVTFNGSGLAGVTLDGLPGNPVTDTFGNYSATVTYGWSGTITPNLAGYIFAPVSQNYSNVTSNQTGQDYTATLMTYTISGTVNYNGSGLIGVTLNGLPGNPVTNAAGTYSATVTYGWSGTVTPTLNGYTFTPVNRTYSNVASNQTGQDYTAALMTYTVSGSITRNGSGVAGVVLNGLPGNPVTNADGTYSAIVTHSWSGTATPTLNGYSFAPVNRTYNNVTSNQTAQNYTATLLTYTVSGRVTYNGSSLANVTLNGLPGNPITNSSGNYTATVPYGWSGTATPTKSGYAFTPVNRSYNNVVSDQTAQNYTATRTYTISGKVTYNGSGLAGVTLSGLPGNPVTNATGNYTTIVNRGWSGTARPILSGYTFSPTRRTYSNVTSNKTSQNYAAYH